MRASIALSYLATIAFLAFCPLPAHAAGSNPQVVLNELYGLVGETCSEVAKTGSYDQVAVAKSYFTPELAKKLSDALATGSIDFDIFTDSQDCGLSDVDLKLTEATAAEATGVALFKNYGEERVVQILMRRTGAEWQIDDLKYGHRHFSLKAEY